MRDPSLHITKSALIEILSQVELRRGKPAISIAEEIFDKAQPYQITGRYAEILKLKANTKKKVAKSEEIDAQLPNGAVQKFHRALNTLRLEQNKHAKIRPITKGSKDYPLLKDITLRAYEFCKHFGVGINEGFPQFIKSGLDSMRKYRLNAFKTYENSIYQKYEAAQEVDNDTEPKRTKFFYEVWRQAMVEYTNLEEIPNISLDKTKYVHLLYARGQADEHKANYVDWVEAQFDQLAFLDAIPELVQFYGENALNRYNRFMTQQAGVADEEENSLIDVYKNNDNE